MRTFTRPASLLAPADPGAHELRNVTGGSGTVLATAAVSVVEARVVVVVPDDVDAGAIFGPEGRTIAQRFGSTVH